MISDSAEPSPSPVSTSDDRSATLQEMDAYAPSRSVSRHSRRHPAPKWSFCATRPSTTSDNEQEDPPSSHQGLSDEHSQCTSGTRATTPDISLRAGLYSGTHRAFPAGKMSLEPFAASPAAPVRLSSGSCNATRSTWSLTSFGTNLFSSSSKSRRGGSSLLTGTALSSIEMKAELTSATISTPPHSLDTSRSNVRQPSDQPQNSSTAPPSDSAPAAGSCASGPSVLSAHPPLPNQKPQSIGKLLSSILQPKHRRQHKADTSDHSSTPSSCTLAVHPSAQPQLQSLSRPSRQQGINRPSQSLYSHPAHPSSDARDSSAGHVGIQDAHLPSLDLAHAVDDRDTRSSESDWDALGGADEQTAGSNVGALDAWQCGPDAWSATVSVSGGSAIADAKIPASAAGSASLLPKSQDGKPLSNGQISEQILSNRMLEMQRSIKALTREELREGRSFASHRQSQQEQQSQRYLASLNSGSLVDALYTHAEQQVDTLLWTSDSMTIANSGLGLGPSFEMDPQGRYQGYAQSDMQALQGPEWHSGGQPAYCTWPEDVDGDGEDPPEERESQPVRPLNGHSLEHLLSMPVDPTIPPKPLTPYKPGMRSPSLSILEALYRGSLPTNISSPPLPEMWSGGDTPLDQQIRGASGVGVDVVERSDAGLRSEGVTQKAQQALQPRRSSMVPKHANGRWTAPEGPPAAPLMSSNPRHSSSWDASCLPPAYSRTAPSVTTSQNGLMNRPSPNNGSFFFGSHVGSVDGAPSFSQLSQQQEARSPGAYRRRVRQSSITEYPRYNLALSKVKNPVSESGETTSRARSSPQTSARPLGVCQSGGDVDVVGWDPLMGSIPLGQQQQHEQQPWLESTASVGIRQSLSSSYSPLLSGREPSEGWDTSSSRLATAASHRTASAAQSDTGSFAPHRQQNRRVGFSNPNNIQESDVATEQQQVHHVQPQRSLNHSLSNPLNQDWRPSQQHFGPIMEVRPPVYNSTPQQQPNSDPLSEILPAYGSLHGKQRPYGLKSSTSARHCPGPNSHQHLSSSTFSSAPIHTERIVSRSVPPLRGLTGEQLLSHAQGSGGPGTVDGSWREMADYPVTGMGMGSSNEYPGLWPQDPEPWQVSSSGTGARVRERTAGLEPGGGVYDSQGMSGRQGQRQGFVGMLDAAAAAGHHSQSGLQSSASAQGLSRRNGARPSPQNTAQFQTMMPHGFPSPFLQQNSRMLDDGYGSAAQQQLLPPANHYALPPVVIRHPLDRYMLGGACAVMLLNIALVIYAVFALHAVRLGV